jgi:hypothetical protein
MQQPNQQFRYNAGLSYQLSPITSNGKIQVWYQTEQPEQYEMAHSHTTPSHNTKSTGHGRYDTYAKISV